MASKPKRTRERDQERLTHHDLARYCDCLGDAAVAEILALQATQRDFETALAWAEQESDVMGKQRRPLEGKAAQIAEILLADELWREEMEARR